MSFGVGSCGDYKHFGVEQEDLTAEDAKRREELKDLTKDERRIVLIRAQKQQTQL
jgi:hypothetical protein